MALPSPVHANAAISGLNCFSPIAIPSSQVGRHGFTGTPVHLYLYPERLQFASKGQLIHTLSAQGNHGRTVRIMVVQSSQQAISGALEGVDGTEGADMSVDSAEASLIQLDPGKQPLPKFEMETPPSEVQGVPYLVENLSEPSTSAATESKVVSGDGTSLIDAIPSSPEASLTNQSSDLESIRSSAEGSVNAIVDNSQEGTDAAKDFVLSDQYKTVKDAYEALSPGTESKVVSGEGTSLIDAVPSSPETSLTNQSSDMESIRSSAEGSVNAIVDNSQEATDAAKDFVLSDQYKTVKDAYEALAPGTESKVVTGEGTSLIDANPSSPETSLTNQSSDLESIRSSAEGSVNAIVDKSQEATDAAKDFVLSDQYKTVKDAYEALSPEAQTSVEPESAVDTVSQASNSFVDSFVEAKSALVNSVRSVQDSLQNSVDEAGNVVKSTYNNINGSFANFIKSISGSYETSMTGLESKASKTPIFTPERLLDALTSAFRMGTPANNALKGVVTTVEDATGAALIAAGNLIAEGYTSTKEVLPANVRLYIDATEKTVSKFAGPVESAVQQVYIIITDAERVVGIDPQNPALPVVLFTGGTIFLGILYWQSRYGGYSGDLTPTSAFDLLRKDGNAVVVDIRPEEVRESEGVLDLRRQVRFKVASVEAMKVQGSLQTLLKNVNDTDAAITATIIKNLKSVQSNTKVIVMDMDGSQSKSIARALKKSGIKMPYLIDGGFRAWTADGLRVKQIGPETPLTIIKEETEAILEEIKPTPGGIVAVTLGIFAGIYALIEWEKSFQLLGLICIAQVLYIRFDSYESVDDMKADLRWLLRPFALATKGILRIAGQVEPSKLQLATSPSTSAVQDRVHQAAAKHGPLPSELDQQQQREQVSEEASPEGIDVTSIQG